ncbi:MAG: EamA family transporter [Treponema sp.]|nr:EamA family transporter [Treponema sp.]MCR5621342.1 EamA family transporter [Treponema sp.]
MIKYYLVIVLAVLLSAVAQLLMKKSAARPHKSIIFEYLNPIVLSGYVLFFCATVINLYALSHVKLAVASALTESLSFICAIITGRVFFRERLTRRKIIGSAVILVGVILVAG